MMVLLNMSVERCTIRTDAVLIVLYLSSDLNLRLVKCTDHVKIVQDANSIKITGKNSQLYECTYSLVTIFLNNQSRFFKMCFMI